MTRSSKILGSSYRLEELASKKVGAPKSPHSDRQDALGGLEQGRVMMNLPACQKFGGRSLGGYFESQHIGVELSRSLDIYGIEHQIPTGLRFTIMLPPAIAGNPRYAVYPYSCSVQNNYTPFPRIANRGDLRHA